MSKPDHDSLPSSDEVFGYFERLSNWGRWGEDDARGTLNFVTPEVTLAAAKEIRIGRSVSCAWDIVSRRQEGDLFGTPQRYMLNHGQGLADADRVTPPHRRPGDRGFGASEFFGLVFHGLNITHIDALSHIFWDRKMYNGNPAEWVTSELGATRLAITDIKEGVSTRGVLLDVARAKGVEWLGPETPVTPEDLERAEEAQGIRVRIGGRGVSQDGLRPLAPREGSRQDDSRPTGLACIDLALDSRARGRGDRLRHGPGRDPERLSGGRPEPARALDRDLGDGPVADRQPRPRGAR